MNSLLTSIIKYPKLKLSMRYMKTFNNHITSLESLWLKQLNIQKPDWESVRKEALEIDKRKINQNNVDYLILRQCNDDNTRKLGINYAKFLENVGNTLSLATMSRLLQIYGYFLRENVKSVENVDVEAEIFRIYEHVMAKHKVLDTTLTESIIYALAATKEWRICLDLMTKLKYETATRSTYESIISVLFLNNEHELAWKLFQEMINKTRKPGDNIYKAYLSHVEGITDQAVFIHKLETLFNFLSTNDILLSHNVIHKFLSVFKSRKDRIKAEITAISVEGKCPKCKTHLPQTIINEEDFNQLKSAFLERVIVGKDVFQKTTPQELEAFNTFISKKRQYDVIIDGLNVAYSAGVKKTVDVTSGFVCSVVEYYARQKKSVLVLGRNHMRKWPHHSRIRKNSDVFLTQNLSQDDPYLLYCALNSGQGTIIVSRDMMRGHLYLLKEPHLKQLFKRWLSITRHQLEAQRRDGKLVINTPPSFINSAQKHENVWHLPILEENSIDPQRNNVPLKNVSSSWLCVQFS